MNTVIIGGGWAGLAAAVELAANGVQVAVLEGARQLGGRARALPFSGHHVDNGQHLLLGAYTSLLSLLARVDVDPASVLRRRRLDLRYVKRGGPRVRLRAGPLPAPLHLAGAVLASGLPARDKWSLLRLFVRMRAGGFRCDPDRPLARYLRDANVAAGAIEYVIEPICLAALNTPLSESSTQVFMRVMRDAFFAGRRASDMLLPTVDLGRCFPGPAMDYIERCGGRVHLGLRAEGLAIRDARVDAVVTASGTMAADKVVIATAPEACAKLLEGHRPLEQLCKRVMQLTPMPITTLYLKYPATVSLGRELVGLLDTTAHWLFDRGILTGEPGLMAAVVSGPGVHMRLEGPALVRRIVDEIAEFFPDWPPPAATKLIREKRATFAAVPGVHALRPGAETEVDGLFLAGDYTATDYPSTLEGAVRSGLRCAHAILQA